MRAAASLPFEQEVAALDEQIGNLRKDARSVPASEVLAQVVVLEKKRDKLLKKLYSNLDAVRTVQVARHPERPQALDYIGRLFTDFTELHGDRMQGDDRAIIGGLARFEGAPVMVIGQHKGRSTEERLVHNFGMPMPEGYRKALRLMRLAERFQLPLLTLVDTAGAYPGVQAEERMQSQAIGENLLALAGLRTRVIAAVIGEGGSGGALGIGVADRMLMLQHAFYSVISPEGCSSILWRSKDRQAEASEALRLTSRWLLKLGLIDVIVPEPVGGAQRDPAAAAANLRGAFVAALAGSAEVGTDDLVIGRARRMRGYGQYIGPR